MTSDRGLILLRIAAVALGAMILAVDVLAHVEVGVPTLYVLVFANVSPRERERESDRWTVASLVAAAIAWALGHARAPDISSCLRLLFAGVAIAVTCGLLISRKRGLITQRALEESRTEMRSFADSVPQLLWRSRPDGRVDYFNRRYTEMTGHSLTEAIERQNWSDYYHPDDLPIAAATHEAAIAGRTQGEVRYKFRMRFADGSYRWMSLVGRAVRDHATGSVKAWYGGTSDVHDEVIAQEAVAKLNRELEARVETGTAEISRTEGRFSALFEMSGITFAEQDLTGALGILARLKAEGVTDLAAHLAGNRDVFAACLAGITNVRVNTALARLLGYDSIEELAATPPVQNAEDAEAVLLRQLEMAFYETVYIEGRTVLVGKDGQHIPVYYNVHRLPGERQLSSHMDLSNQERIEEMRLAAQEELARANRVATVGAFSASIAHELNQPIASMSMDIQTAKRALSAEAPDLALGLRILDRISRTTERVVGIVGRTRAQIASGRRTLVEIDMCELARESLQLLERELRNRRTRVHFHCTENRARVLGNRIDLQQVLVNLLTNAMDAMETITHRMIDLSITDDGMRVRVSVADNGPGIPEASLHRLFEPFFTTKENGVGMGLQICRSTIESLDGELVAGNRPEGGAIFEFSLPLSVEMSEVA